MLLQHVRATAAILIFGMVSGAVEIPGNLRNGKMARYPACQKLFSQNELPYAVVSEQSGDFKQSCNCSFLRNPPRSNLNIHCLISREIVVPITIADYSYLGQMLYYLIQHRKRGTSDQWKQKRIDVSDRQEARLDLEIGDMNNPAVYEVEVYIVLGDGTRRRIQREVINSRTGRTLTESDDSVDDRLIYKPGRGDAVGGAEYTQFRQTFSVNFDHITDTSMEVHFMTKSADSYKIEYLDGTRKIPLPLDSNGRASVRDLQPATEYIFIFSVYRNGEWVEMRRKPVRTMATIPSYGGSVYHPVYVRQDITLQCPEVDAETLLAISWFKGQDGGTTRLLATYDAETDTTTYPSDKDSRISVVGGGRILQIREPTAEYAGVYKCRYSILGLGDTWQAAVQARVTLYITWRTRNGIETYLIQYRPFDSNAQWQQLTFTNSGTPGAVITDLQPLTKYEFEVYDYSEGEKGDLLDSLTRTTSASSSQPVTIEPVEVPRREVDHCETYPCVNGNCRNIATGYECLCHQGYTGASCEREIDYCISQPCGNGNCRSTATGYECLCHPGYIGANCERAIDFCAPLSPCRNGGRCLSHSSGYQCLCRAGYFGTNCEEELNHCDPNPCLNSGICMVTSSRFTCRCRRGFDGRRCETVVALNYCETRPCVYGSCINLQRSYRCKCNLDYKGRNCDQFDDSQYIILRCPIESDLPEEPELIRWYKYDDGVRKIIYQYDAVNHGTEVADQYRGRLSSPTINTLKIADAGLSDHGMYQCSLSYDDIRSTSYPMNLLNVPDGLSQIRIEWTPSEFDTDRYAIQYRDAMKDGRYIEQQIPIGASTHDIDYLQPGGIYEIELFQSPRDGGEKIPIQFIPSRSDHHTDPSEKEPEEEPEPTSDTSSGRRHEHIPVRVFAPIVPVATGANADIECDYPPVRTIRPTISWKKISNGKSVFLYNQKMPPTQSAGRRNMINEKIFRIKNFQPTDAGMYECSVNFSDGETYKVGSGTAAVEALEAAALPAPTNFKHVIMDQSTTIIRWQQPHSDTSIRYVIRYWPTTRRFGEYTEQETSSRQFTLNDLTEGNEYNVEIRATDGKMFSEPLIGQFDQLIEEVPTPENFQATMLSSTESQIDWDQPDTEGITGYSVQYWDVGLPSQGNMVELQTTSPSATLSGLRDGRTYQVWIEAMRGLHPSRQLAGQFTKVTPVPPNSPRNIRFKNIGSDTATIYWQPPSGWTPTDKFRVHVASMNEEAPFSKQFPDAAPRTLIVRQLRPGVLYKFTVYTIRGSLLSRPVHKYMRTVQNIYLAAPYPEKLTLECNAHITGEPYRVMWYKISSLGYEQPLFNSTVTTTKREFIPNTEATQYIGRLSSQSLRQLDIADIQHPNDFGQYKCTMPSRYGDASDMFELIARYPQRIEPPVRFSFVRTGDTSTRIMWQHPYHDDITSYAVRFWPTINRFGQEKSLETKKLWAELTGLIKGTEYQVEIKSKINNRVSDDSLIGQFINFADTVRNVRIDRLGDGVELRLTWDNPPGQDGVQISFRGEGSIRWNDQPPMSPDTTSRTVRIPLQDGETVSFKITSLKNNIPSPVVVKYTEHSLVDIEEPGPSPEVSRVENPPLSGAQLPYPSPPSDLVLESVSPTILRVRWIPTPDVHFDTYAVNVTNVLTGQYEKFDVRKSYIQIAHLTAYGTYQVTVSTVRNGIHSFPIVNEITLGDVGEAEPTEEPEPGPADETKSHPAPQENWKEREVSSDVPSPLNLRFSQVMRARFMISWDAPEEDITDFEVKYRPMGIDGDWLKEEVFGGTSHIIRELIPDTVYEVEVSSYVTGEKSLPTTGTQRTLASTPRRVILRQPNAMVTDKTDSSFRVKWVPQDADHRVVVTPLGGAGRRQTLNVERGTNQVVITGLDAGRMHRTTVSAISDGRRSKSAVLRTTTNPQKPENVTIVAVDSDTASVKWTEPLSTLQTGYRVIYISESTGVMKDKDTTSNRVDLTDLDPGTTYNVQVRTKQGNDLSASESVRFRTREDTVDVPGDVRVTASEGTLQIGWSPVDDALFYQVETYLEDDEENAMMNIVTAPTTNLEIENLLPGHYVITIAAGDENTLSDSRIMTFAMPVEAPRNLQIENTQSDGFRASWQAPTTELYTPQYEVITLPNSIHSPIHLPSEKRTSLTFLDFERMRPNTEYQVQVVSRYEDLKSEPAVALVTTAPFEAPRDLESSILDGIMRISWSPVYGADNYKVTYYPVDDTTDSTSVFVQTPFHDITNVQPGEYEIMVVAVKEEQEGPSSTVQQAMGLDSPSNIRFTDVSDDSFVVEWIPPRTRQRLQYEIRVSTVSNPTQPVDTKVTEENWGLIQDLSPGTQYTVDVTAVFGNQRSEPATGEVNTVVPTPARVEVPDTANNKPVEVSWQWIPEADSYSVIYYPTSGGSPMTLNVPGSRNRVTLRNLTPETQYIVQVIAHVGDEESEPNQIEFTTGHVGQPDDLEAEVSSGIARVTWTPVENVDEYEVKYFIVGREASAVTKMVIAPYYDITGVEPGEYEIVVTAIKSGYRSPTSVLEQTIGVKAPSELQFTDIAEDTFVAVWRPSSSPDVTRYEVRTYIVDDVAEPIIREVTENWIEMLDLTPGTDYHVEIRARTEDEISRPLSGVVETVVPSPQVIHGSVLSGADAPVEISWEEVPNVDSYEVSYYPVDGDMQVIEVNQDTSSTVLSGLLPDTEYIIEVKSIVNGKRSEPTKIRITTPLSTPDNVLVQPDTGDSDEQGSSTITITWEDQGKAQEYEIKYYSVLPADNETLYGTPQYKIVSASDEGVVLTDLLPATEYIIEVKSLDGSKTSRPNTVTVLTKLDKPGNLEVQEPGEDTITVNWQPPEGQVTEYVVRLVPSDGSDVMTLPVNANRNSVTASGLKPGTEYEVSVVALNRNKGIESTPLTNRVKTKPLNTKPTNVRTIPESDGSYTITWNAPDHEVHYYTFTWSRVAANPMEESLQVFDRTEARTSPLEPNTEYMIIIQSITDAARAPTEYDSTRYRLRTGIPGLESEVTFPDVTDNSIVVQWEVPSQERFLTGYRVQAFLEGEVKPIKTVDVPRTRNSVSLRGLEPSTTYRITVTPHVDNIPGQSATQIITTDAIRRVPAPDYVTIPEVTSEDIVVQWYHPAGHQYITQYNVLVQDKEGNIITDETVPGNANTLTVSGLSPATPYEIYVRSVIDGRKSERVPETATTLPREPANVTTRNTLSNQFEIFWSPDVSGDVSAYLVTVTPEDNSDLPEIFYQTQDTSILIPGVQPDTTYRVEVIAVGNNDQESNPTVIRVTTGITPEETPDPDVQPQQAITLVPGMSEMVINWQPYTDAPVSLYQIIYQPQGADQPSIITVPSEAGEIVLSQLEPITQYDIWVRGVLENGAIVPVPILEHETVTRIEPENYVPLTEDPVTAPADGKVSLIWEDLGPDVTQYGVTYSGPDLTKRQQVIPGDYTSTLLGGLVPDGEYIISVIGMRNGVEPVLVNNVHVGMTDFVPDETEVSGTTSNGQITLQWVSDVEEDDDNKVIGYKIIFDRKCCLGEPEMAWVPGKETETATIGMLEPDTEYVFRVEAATSDGQNIPVSTVEIVDEMEFPETRLTENLRPPTNIILDAQGYTSTIHWNPPEEGSRPVTHYTITYVPRNNEFAPMLRVTVPKSETSHTITGLSPNTQYQINIQSTNLPTRTISQPETITLNTPNDDDFRPEIELTMRPMTAPTVPTVVILTPQRTEPLLISTRVTEPLRSTIRPSISEPAGQPDGNTLIFTPQDSYATMVWEPFYTDVEQGRYRITYFPRDRPDHAREVVLPSYLETITITGLTPDNPYEAHVEAVSDTNEEIPRKVTMVEEEATLRFLPFDQWTFKPSITDIERQGENSAVIHWTKARRQPRRVTHYILQLRPKYSIGDDNSTMVKVLANQTLMHTFTGLLPNEHYEVILQAMNRKGSGSQLAEKEFINSAPVISGGDASLSTSHPTAPSTTATESTTLMTTRATTAATTRQTLVTPETLNTPLPEPLRLDESEPNTSGSSEPTEDDFDDAEPGVGALPTFDGNIIINWTPVRTPVDNYILRWEPVDGSMPAENITVPGDRTWANVPEVPQGGGHRIQVFTSTYGEEPELIYTISLNRPTDDENGLKLVYHSNVKTLAEDGTTTSIETSSDSAHEVYIPIENPEDTLPDDHYLLQRPGVNLPTIEDHEYVNWLQPIQRRVEGANRVTLRWSPRNLNPMQTTGLTRYKLTLVPINNSDAKPIVTYVPANAPHDIHGLEPGVSYRLNAKYVRGDLTHHAGDLAANFSIPAFSRYGTPITERRRYGITEVWMKELRSGELLLQWEEFPGAEEYRIEHQETPNGKLYQDAVHPDQRWIVLPRLTPGHMYTLNIFATLDSVSTKIYTVTVRRKVIGPAPPGKMEWYNMFGHSVDLSWVPPQGYITGYRLTYRLAEGDDTENEIFLPARNITYHLDYLKLGETYIITLQSVRDGKLSRALSFPLRMSIPTVRRIFFQQTSPNMIMIRWPKLPDYVTGYLVQVKTISPVEADLVPPKTLPPDQASFNINNVMPGVRYEFTVKTLVDQAVSDPVTLHLWTLKAQSELTREEQTGTWSLSWTGNPNEVDYWRIEVRRAGSNTPLILDDRVDRFQTQYELRGLTPGVEYIVYIYGVKNNVLSTPIQIHVPANPYNTVSQGGQDIRRQQAHASGPQLLKKFIVRRKSNQIEIELIPTSTVDRYIVKYKKSTESFYRTNGVTISHDKPTATVLINYLDPGSSYNITITAIKGGQSSEMSINVETPVRNIVTQSLPPLFNIRHQRDPNPDGTGFYITWSPPIHLVSYYTVTYNYTGMDEAISLTSKAPSFYVPILEEGQRARFVIGYTTVDGKKGPRSVLTMSYGRRSNANPRTGRSHAHRENERRGDTELP